MTEPTYDCDFWEGLWSKTLSERSDQVARRPPNGHLIAEVGGLNPGLALDSDRWELVVAEDRRRAAAHTGVDAVIRARRR